MVFKSTQKKVDEILSFVDRNPDASIRDVAKVGGCSTMTVIRLLKKHGFSPGELQAFKKERADIYALFQSKLIDTLTEDDLKLVHPLSRLKMMEIFHKMERLERNQSTENVGAGLIQFIEEAHRREPEEKDITPAYAATENQHN